MGSIIQEFEDFDVNQDYLIGGVVSNNPESFFPIPKKGYRSGYSKFTDSELKSIQNGVDGAYLIINLKTWRKNNVENLAIETLFKNTDKLVLAEQDILAIVCYPHIKKISMSYVVSNGAWNTLGEDFSKISPNIYSKEEILQASKNPIQIHYSGGAKPWNTPSVPKSELWFKYLCKTPFLRDFLENFEKIIINNYKKTSLLNRLKNFIIKLHISIQRKDI